jgi:hypothetical protein
MQSKCMRILSSLYLHYILKKKLFCRVEDSLKINYPSIAPSDGRLSEYFISVLE